MSVSSIWSDGIQCALYSCIGSLGCQPPQLLPPEATNNHEAIETNEGRHNGQILDPELLINIFSHLDNESIGQASLVCRHWQSLASNNTAMQKRITDCALDQVGKFPMSKSREELIPHLINSWQSRLSEYASTANVANGLSMLSIPEAWTTQPQFFKEYEEIIQTIFYSVVFSALATHQDSPIEEFTQSIAFYADNNCPTYFSDDFCAALCEGINCDDQLNGLSITASCLNDQKVKIIAKHLQNHKMKHIHLYGNFKDEGIQAITEALPNMIPSTSDDILIELLAQDCKQATQILFEKSLNNLHLSGQLMIKKESALYAFPY